MSIAQFATQFDSRTIAPRRITQRPNKGVLRAYREVKRAEADERNAHTPLQRRRRPERHMLSPN